MSYDKAYAGGWQDGSSGMTPINADALNHMEQGIIDGQRLWKALPAQQVTAESGGNIIAMTEAFPERTGYTRRVTNLRSANSNLVIIGWRWASDGIHPEIRIRNLSSSAVTDYINLDYEYYSNEQQWT